MKTSSDTPANPTDAISTTNLEAAATRDTGLAESKAETADDATLSVAAERTNAKTESASIARSAGIVSIAVMGSRVLGLVREMVMARFFGAGFLMDAFVVAFRIPNLMRDLFAEGALSAAFVKTFTNYLVDEDKGEQAAWRLANMVMNLLVVVLSVITILGIILSPQLVTLLTQLTDDGFSVQQAALAVTMTRIMFPFLLLVALAAVAMGVLNSKKQFGIPATASTLFNVGSILGGLFFAYLLSGGDWTTPADPRAVPELAAQRAIIGMAIGTLIGGACQFLIQVPALWQVGFRYRPLLSFTDPGVRQVMRLMGPAIIGTAAVQINVVVNTIFATDIAGGAGWLNYAFRLMQFPIGVFGVAIATATMPSIARFAAQKDIASFRDTLASSMGLVFLLTLPSACGLVVLGRPIISLIYERGAFTAFDTQMVAYALAGYSVGLAGYAAIKILSPAFYQLDDARTPMTISLFSIVINIIANYYFKELLSTYRTPTAPEGYGHVGLALSTSCIALANFSLLTFLMRRKIGGINGRAILSSFTRIAIASLALSIASYATYTLLFAQLGDRTFLARFVEVFIPISIGSAVFILAARLLRIAELDQALGTVVGRFRRRTRSA